MSDVILYVRHDGGMWTEHQTYEMLSLDGDLPTENIIAIEDGTEVPPPILLWYPPNREGYQD